MQLRQTTLSASLSSTPLKITNPRSTAAWLPALLGLSVICCESTRVMGADHTMLWLSRLCSPLIHLANANLAELNHVLRKSGHFFGYGTLGLIFLQAWRSLLATHMHQTWAKLRVLAGIQAIASVALVASMDELHQSFLPNRTACISDALLDTSGAVILIALTSFISMLRRKRTLEHLLESRRIRQWENATTLFPQTLLRGTH